MELVVVADSKQKYAYPAAAAGRRRQRRRLRPMRQQRGALVQSAPSTTKKRARLQSAKTPPDGNAADKRALRVETAFCTKQRDQRGSKLNSPLAVERPRGRQKATSDVSNAPHKLAKLSASKIGVIAVFQVANFRSFARQIQALRRHPSLQNLQPPQTSAAARCDLEGGSKIVALCRPHSRLSRRSSSDTRVAPRSRTKHNFEFLSSLSNVNAAVQYL